MAPGGGPGDVTAVAVWPSRLHPGGDVTVAGSATATHGRDAYGRGQAAGRPAPRRRAPLALARAARGENGRRRAKGAAGFAAAAQRAGDARCPFTCRPRPLHVLTLREREGGGREGGRERAEAAALAAVAAGGL